MDKLTHVLVASSNVGFSPLCEQRRPQLAAVWFACHRHSLHIGVLKQAFSPRSIWAQFCATCACEHNLRCERACIVAATAVSQRVQGWSHCCSCDHILLPFHPCGYAWLLARVLGVVLLRSVYMCEPSLKSVLQKCANSSSGILP